MALILLLMSQKFYQKNFNLIKDKKQFMNILVTGNNGYIGSVLTKILLEKGYSITGLDINYFESCTIEDVNQNFHQIIKDIRDVNSDDLIGFDAIIHLAGLSNDPLGELNPSLTQEINFDGTVKLGHLAKKAGINRLVYASSQSMYGISKLVLRNLFLPVTLSWH